MEILDDELSPCFSEAKLHYLLKVQKPSRQGNDYFFFLIELTKGWMLQQNGHVLCKHHIALCSAFCQLSGSLPIAKIRID